MTVYHDGENIIYNDTGIGEGRSEGFYNLPDYTPLDKFDVYQEDKGDAMYEELRKEVIAQKIRDLRK